mmetsp:Transcript_18547/g.33588  ORF Transcript_18547/g.33588 Transcript_18547/m.33588 type:complete len:320 (-) Transcript_18547:757-1716(-)
MRPAITLQWKIFWFLVLIQGCLSMSAIDFKSRVSAVCSCQDVTVWIGGVTPGTPTIDCHCPRCRKFHVSAFASYLKVPSDLVQNLDISKVKTISDSCSLLGPVDRLFCRQCFGKIATKQTNCDDEYFYISMGMLDDETLPEQCSTTFQTNRAGQNTALTSSWHNAKPILSRHRILPLTKNVVTGGCSCGTFRYQFNLRFPSELQHCYCRLCRKLSGSAFMTWVPTKKSDFLWVDQIEPALVRTTGHGCRHICQECGGVLTIIYDSQPELIWPAAGGFDDESIPSNYSDYLGRVIHICCTWKQDWYAIPEDGMPRVKHAS